MPSRAGLALRKGTAALAWLAPSEMSWKRSPLSGIRIDSIGAAGGGRGGAGAAAIKAGSR